MKTHSTFRLAFVILASAAALWITPGCEEEDPEEQQQLSTEEMLEGKWRMVAYTRTDSAGNVTDLYGSPTDCGNDDTIIFQAGGVFIVDAAVSICDSLDPQQDIGTWSLSADETFYTTILDIDTIQHTILKLTEDTLRSSYFDDEVGTETLTMVPY